MLEKALNVVNDQISALNNLHSQLIVDQKKFEKIMTILLGHMLNNYKTRIIISGVGKNANLATKASETFASLGIPSMYLNTCHYSHGDAGFIGPNDTVLHISRSGKTDEMQYAARHLKIIRPNVKQILLHCNSELTDELKEPFDEEFGVSGIIECDENSLAPTSSTTVLLTLLDTIGIILSSSINFSRQDFYNYHPGGSLGSMLKGEK